MKKIKDDKYSKECRVSIKTSVGQCNYKHQQREGGCGPEGGMELVVS